MFFSGCFLTLCSWFPGAWKGDCNLISIVLLNMLFYSSSRFPRAQKIDWNLILFVLLSLIIGSWLVVKKVQFLRGIWDCEPTYLIEMFNLLDKISLSWIPLKDCTFNSFRNSNSQFLEAMKRNEFLLNEKMEWTKNPGKHWSLHEESKTQLYHYIS